ncbi:MAG: YMGG-like glycine zipper-containing protein [Gallionella sp.]
MRRSIFSVSLLGILAGCVTVPNGPSVAVMPAPGKPFDLFVAEDRQCRQFAQQSIGGATAQQAATNSAVESIAVGTALGAVAGAAMGGSGQNGAGTGAAVGMLSGAAMGSQASQYSGREAQRRYDIAYEQCMYAKGNQLPQSSAYQPRAIYSQPPAPPTEPSYNSPPPPPPPSR